MPAPGENCAGDVAVQSGQKPELAFVETQGGVAAAEGDAVVGFEAIDGGGVDAQGAQGVIEFVGIAAGDGRSGVGGLCAYAQRSRAWQKTKTQEQASPYPPHDGASVVTFGNTEQAHGRWSARAH